MSNAMIEDMDGIDRPMQARQATPPATLEPQSIMSAIVSAAQNPDVDPDKMERMMALYERIEAKQAEAQFNVAMNACQKEMRRVQADATNPQTSSNYATYAALDRALRPIYTSHGLSLSFDTGEAASGYVRVKCYVAHESGHSRTYQVDMPADGLGAKGNAVMTKTHAAGSAMSYGMRYLLKLIFNVAVGEDDDDGNGAVEVSGPSITDEQLATLRDMLEAKGKKEPKLVDYLKQQKVRINHLGDLPASKYQFVVELLERS